jgi:hypothetical protein
MAGRLHTRTSRLWYTVDDQETDHNVSASSVLCIIFAQVYIYTHQHLCWKDKVRLRWENSAGQDFRL